MSAFEEFWSTLVEEIGSLARSQLERFKDEAISDAKDFLEGSREDLQRWALLVEEGRLTRADLEFLVQGRISLARMRALERAGLARADIDRFRRSVVNLFIDSAFKILVPA